MNQNQQRHPWTSSEDYHLAKLVLGGSFVNNIINWEEVAWRYRSNSAVRRDAWECRDQFIKLKTYNALPDLRLPPPQNEGVRTMIYPVIAPAPPSANASVLRAIQILPRPPPSSYLLPPLPTYLPPPPPPLPPPEKELAPSRSVELKDQASASLSSPAQTQFNALPTVAASQSTSKKPKKKKKVGPFWTPEEDLKLIQILSNEMLNVDPTLVSLQPDTLGGMWFLVFCDMKGLLSFECSLLSCVHRSIFLSKIQRALLSNNPSQLSQKESSLVYIRTASDQLKELLRQFTLPVSSTILPRKTVGPASSDDIEIFQVFVKEKISCFAATTDDENMKRTRLILTKAIAGVFDNVGGLAHCLSRIKFFNSARKVFVELYTLEKPSASIVNGPLYSFIEALSLEKKLYLLNDVALKKGSSSETKDSQEIRNINKKLYQEYITSSSNSTTLINGPLTGSSTPSHEHNQISSNLMEVKANDEKEAAPVIRSFPVIELPAVKTKYRNGKSKFLMLGQEPVIVERDFWTLERDLELLQMLLTAMSSVDSTLVDVQPDKLGGTWLVAYCSMRNLLPIGSTAQLCFERLGNLVNARAMLFSNDPIFLARPHQFGTKYLETASKEVKELLLKFESTSAIAATPENEKFCYASKDREIVRLLKKESGSGESFEEILIRKTNLLTRAIEGAFNSVGGLANSIPRFEFLKTARQHLIDSHDTAIVSANPEINSFLSNLSLQDKINLVQDISRPDRTADYMIKLEMIVAKLKSELEASNSTDNQSPSSSNQANNIMTAPSPSYSNPNEDQSMNDALPLLFDEEMEMELKLEMKMEAEMGVDSRNDGLELDIGNNEAGDGESEFDEQSIGIDGSIVSAGHLIEVKKEKEEIPIPIPASEIVHQSTIKRSSSASPSYSSSSPSTNSDQAPPSKKIKLESTPATSPEVTTANIINRVGDVKIEVNAIEKVKEVVEVKPLVISSSNISNPQPSSPLKRIKLEPGLVIPLGLHNSTNSKDSKVKVVKRRKEVEDIKPSVPSTILRAPASPLRRIKPEPTSPNLSHLSELNQIRNLQQVKVKIEKVEELDQVEASVSNSQIYVPQPLPLLNGLEKLLADIAAQQMENHDW